MVLRSDFEDAKTEISRLTLELKHSEMKTSHLEEDASNAQKEISDMQANLESQIGRCESLEEEHRKREVLLQQEIDHATFNESKVKEKCEQNELLFHETRREKDEQIFDLKRIAERVPTLEEQIGDVENQKSETELLLNELRDAICQRIRKEDDVVESDASQSSPKEVKDETSEDISPVTPEEIEQYFKQADSDMRSLQEQIVNLSQQVDQEQSMMADLSTTIGSLRNELGRAQTDLTNNVKSKDNIQDQYKQATEKIKVQEKNMERKNKEIEHLRELIQDYERQIEKLNADLNSASTQMLQNTATHKEEEIQLQLVAQGLEKDIDSIEQLRKNEEQKHTEEADSLKSIIDNQNKTLDDQNVAIENQNKEVRELRAEMENLIEDNKNLAQRLIHLESYSNKLSEMLDKNQTADDKAREKAQNEIKEYKSTGTAREAEIIDLTKKVNELNESNHEQADKLEQLDKKTKELLSGLKESESQKSDARKEKDELEKKLQTVSDAHLTAEQSVVKQTEHNQLLNKSCGEQQKTIGELNEKIIMLENERSSMKDTVSTMERGIRLKESLIAELSRKSGETNESVATLKSSMHKAENEKRLSDNKLNMFRHEKSVLEKQVRENDDEKLYLRDQVNNLQRLLAKAEDEKEVSLGNLAHLQNQSETLRAMKDKSNLKELESQIQSLRVELNLERQRRERLEARYIKRDDQVSQLRSTFDQSLNTISKDTKNIKNLLGKSLQKIDRIQDNEATDSSIIETDSEALITPTTKLNTSKYLSLPSHRSKSMECSVDTLGEKIKSSSPRKYKYGDTPKSSPVSATKPLSLSNIRETPVRDAMASYRKTRLSR